MVYENSHVLEVTKSMYKYPWLDHRDRAKEHRRATAIVHLPLSCYQMPKEEYPPSPEVWRQHQSRLHAVPYCYSQKPEIYSHWHTFYDPKRERESPKILFRKMQDQERGLREMPEFQKLHVPLTKLLPNSQVGSRPSRSTLSALKCQRLKELTQSLKSPREEEQLYAAQALGCLGISDKVIMEALWAVAKTGAEKVKFEACRTLALLGCLNKYVIQVLMHQLKGQNEDLRMETLLGLRIALNNWVAVPKDKRTPVGDEGKLVCLLQMLMRRLPTDAALEAALSLGFLRPCNTEVQEFLLRCLGQGPKTQRMKALTMLVRKLRVHSAEVIRAILEQLCSSSVLEHRMEATKMLRMIGLEKIQAQGLQRLTFDLLRKKIYNEPFLAMRQTVAETAEQLKMKPMMMNLVEEQLKSQSVAARQEAVISLGVLGVRSPRVYHLLLDMLDAEKSQELRDHLKKTLILLASSNPWIRKRLKNKVLFVHEEPPTTVKPEPTRFRTEPESPEELNIQDFQLVQLRPFFIAQSSTKMDQQTELTAHGRSDPHFTISPDAVPSRFSKAVKDLLQANGPCEPQLRRQPRKLVKTSKQITSACRTFTDKAIHTLFP
ncbi:LOW QUALITY PROTEIN: protein HEATR9 [Echinops telfairi]|uniref:LOW QUALITY PROTEIN: protein HEATR9 n=1 Tax=Echinops telfairi TaxID=9371 RepID=A0ABM0ITN5_ECHTE|nr:LOW QUALITY PROTEIN: protein HEATR9 [Echinops telfairi]